LDRIAYLYQNENLPVGTAGYFENEFRYALTMKNWIIGEYDQIEKLPKGKKDTWSDLDAWCSIQSFEPLEKEQLPKSMLNYKDLLDEEVDTFSLLNLVKDYGKILADFTKQERDLKTKIDCDVYSMAYLDTLDQITYLQKQNAIPKEVTRYFENNFAYGLNLWDWYNQNVRDTPIRKDKEEMWTDLLDWCGDKNIEPFDGEVLPKPMLRYKKLK